MGRRGRDSMVIEFTRLVHITTEVVSSNPAQTRYTPGADPGFQVRGVHLKKLRRAKGGAKIFGVFRVKNHDFTPKNHIFSPGSTPVLNTILCDKVCQ
jgi:hypothetical protein